MKMKLGSWTGLRNIQKINQARSDRLEELQSAAAQRAAERIDERKYKEGEHDRRIAVKAKSDFRKTLLKDALSLNTFGAASDGTSTTKKSSGITPKAALAGLTAYGVNANVLANFKTSAEEIGNPYAIVAAFKKMKSFRSTLVKDLGVVEGDEVFNEAFLPKANALLENAIFEPSSQANPSLLIAKIENIIGEELDDLYKNAISSKRRTPGSFVFPTEMEFSKPISVADLGNWKNVITSDVVDRGENEKNLIDRLSRVLNKELVENSHLSADLIEVYQQTNEWLLERHTKISDAVDNATGENKSYANIVALYGNSFKKYYDVYPKLKNALLPEFLTRESSKQPISVPNIEVLNNLRVGGIILAGDVVIIGNDDPQTVPENKE